MEDYYLFLTNCVAEGDMTMSVTDCELLMVDRRRMVEMKRQDGYFCLRNVEKVEEAEEEEE